MKNYHYPIEETWSTEEIINVVSFFNLVEQAYETGVNRKDILMAYQQFKKIVPSKSEEKRYFSEFMKASGYSCYQVVKTARELEQNRIRL